jgi:nucleoside-diphosphate kinase
VGEIIARFEQKGYKLVGAKVLVPSRELASLHYAEHDGKPFFPKLVDFLSSGAVVALAFEGKGVVAYGRTMIGATNPLASSPGTIRGDYGIDVGQNIIHGSDSVEVSIPCLASLSRSSSISPALSLNVSIEIFAECPKRIGLVVPT